MKPHRKSHPCPICGGHRDLPQGHGVRCWGYTADDGEYAHCSREERAGPLPLHEKSRCYVHRLRGDCKCGETHGEAEVRSIGEARGARIAATYDYHDADGQLVYQVVRKDPKAFLQRRPDGAGGWVWGLGDVATTLYRLPELVAAVAAGDTVWIAEGEKDCDALHRAGVVATCNSGGAGKFRADFARYFSGADVVIVRDKDDPGTKHAREVFAHLRGVAATLRVVEARTGKDAYDHLASGGTPADFVPVWPAADLRQTDPVAWKRRALRMSFDTTEPIREVDPKLAMERPAEPTWPTGLGATDRLTNFRGVVIVAGMPSAGKSVLALGSGIEAAEYGWDVLYLSAEMAERPFARRLMARCRGEVPRTFHHIDVTYGASVESLLDWIEARVTESPTLVIFDSVSSFCDQAEKQDSDDPHGMALLKRLVMWAINVRRATDGQVAFMLLAEASKEGRARGRFADHKADLALLMETSTSEPSVKVVSITKAWEYQTGEVGEFGVNVNESRLVKL